MPRTRLHSLLAAVAAGELTPSEAVDQVAALATGELGIARLDLLREHRAGHAEAVYAAGKRLDDVRVICAKLLEAHGRVLVTRLAAEPAATLVEELPHAVYHERARVLTAGVGPEPRNGAIAVVSAGTSDLPIAEEAAVCASYFGHEVTRLDDVGVAGLHRLLGSLDQLRGARVIVAVAGMDGVLPTLVAGLVPAPVVAVPTSVGYGAHFGGLAPLLTMLNSCAPGVAVVNIDNGYGAAVLASRIAGLD